MRAVILPEIFFFFNLFGLLMTGYRIPISLSCSPSPLLLPAVAWRTVLVSIWRQAV